MDEIENIISIIQKFGMNDEIEKKNFCKRAKKINKTQKNKDQIEKKKMKIWD